ncbi:MAG TPA: hypothetical protein VGX70_19580 [Gemmataceae bacterium]|jgi:hypothetical protein|nr:hypothetical protein [Gemmataceae bacterium]
MKKELTMQVGPDGHLNLAVDLGQNGANKKVHVVVETVEEPQSRLTTSREDWIRFVQSMAGRITDPTFCRQPQGDYENRERFP